MAFKGRDKCPWKQVAEGSDCIEVFWCEDCGAMMYKKDKEPTNPIHQDELRLCPDQGMVL